MPGRSSPATLFYSYAHADEALRDLLEKHLSLLQRQGLLASWHDRALLPGDGWAGQIDQHLNDADLILLLVSADFLASDYCYDVEMKRALERHQRGEARVLPIIVRPCDWSKAPFGTLQALPRNGRAITNWNNQDEAMEDVAKQIRRLLEQPQTAQSSRLTEASTQRNRKAMQDRLRQWYQDFIDGSLQHAVWLDLGFADKPDALDTPVRLLIRGTTLPERLLPPGTSILEIYDEANQTLLILGEPGAGKSTQLYTLGQHLLTRAETDPQAPLPFVFALSSWANKQQPLEIWMAEQLQAVYFVPKKLAQQWVATGQVLPLFDGLDEMVEHLRPRCIEEINRTHQEHLSPLVVCCRSAEYTTAVQTARFQFQRAVVVQPLSQQQITETLQRGGEAQAGLQAVYPTNAALQELSTMPLLLHLLMLTYQNIAVQDLPTQEKTLRERVFHAYVERMITQRGNYPRAVTIRWLHVLATQMQVHQMTEWAIEQLQPDWLPPSFLWRYQWSVWLSVVPIFGLVVALVVVVGAGLLAWLFVILGVGLVVALIFRQQKKIEMAEELQWSLKKGRSGVIFGLVGGLLFGLVGGLLFGLSGGLSDELSEGLIDGLAGGLVGGLIVGLVGGLVGGLLFGLSTKTSLDRFLLSPGEGLRRSLTNGLIVGVIFGLIFGLIDGVIVGLIGELLFGLSEGLNKGLSEGLSVGLIGGLVGGLIGGLEVVFQHVLLRFWLWSSRSLPFRLIPFLEDACARHLLKRVGGTYQFMHRLLLEYFASQDPQG